MLNRDQAKERFRDNETKCSPVISRLSVKSYRGLCRLPPIRAIWSGACKRWAWDHPVNRAQPSSRSFRADFTKSRSPNLEGTTSGRATQVWCVVLLASQLFAPGLTLGSARCYHFFGAEPVVLADPTAPLNAQEPKGVLTLNQSTAAVRLFKVTGARVVNSTLVIEYVERGEFKDWGGCGIDGTFLAEVLGTATADKCTFTALYALGFHGLGKTADLPPVARSIDEAVDKMSDQSEALMRERTEFFERWRREHPIKESGERELPGVHTEPQSVGKGSGPVGQWVEVSPQEQRRIEEQAKQEIREVWSYGRGKRIEWKPVSRTPAGRDCEVLIVDGEELLYPGPASIETSPPKSR